MKKIYLSLFFIMSCASTITAQLIGTKNIPGDYGSLAAAITDLNAQGVGVGGVTFNLVAGTPQTAPAGGYVIGNTGSLVLTTASSSNPIVFQGNANVITAASPQTAGSVSDAIFKLIGADYVTINNFVLNENPANTVNTPVTSNDMTEFGIGQFYVTPTDGAQNNTYSNNVISLNRAYLNTFGIFSTARAALADLTLAADATTAAGANSNTKIYANGISNVNTGICFVGSGTVGAFDTGNDIGGTTAPTGNNITNWGGGSILTLYAGLFTSNNCVFMSQQLNDNVSFNTIVSGAGVATGIAQHNGILRTYSALNPPVGTISTSTLNNNSITLANAPTTGQLTGISTQQPITPAVPTMTVNINNNNISGTISGGAATTASILAIFAVSSIGTVNANNNTIQNLVCSSPAGAIIGISFQQALVVNAININGNRFGTPGNPGATFTAANPSGTCRPFEVQSTGAAATCAISMNGNDVQGIVHVNNGTGAVTLIGNTAPTISQNLSNNTFTNLSIKTTGNVTFLSNSVALPAGGSKVIDNNSISGSFAKTLGAGTVSLYSDGALSPGGTTTSNQNNNFSNITLTGSTAFNGWQNLDGLGATATAKTVSGNTITNVSGGTGALTGMSVGFSGAGTVISGNVINNISGAGQVVGMLMSGGAGTIQTFSQNRIGNLLSSAGSVFGVVVTSGQTQTISRNKVFNLQSNGAVTIAVGIQNQSTTAGTVTISNNLVGNLTAPAASNATTSSVRGLNLTTATVNTSTIVNYNTVFLNASSSGANFSTAAIFHSANVAPTTGSLILNNNAFVNLSTASGTGAAIAFQRSGTDLSNLGATTNNNLYFAGTPGPANLIYADGVNNYQALATYQAAVAPRDIAAVTGNPAFITTNGASVNFLHVTVNSASVLANAGAPVAGQTVDYDNDARDAITPDIGADEFSPGTALSLPPAITPANPYTSRPRNYRSDVFDIVTIAPNPVRTITEVSVNAVKAGVLQFLISDQNGRVAMRFTSPASKGLNQMRLDLSKLSAGTYVISAINSEGEKQSINFMKF